MLVNRFSSNEEQDIRIAAQIKTNKLDIIPPCHIYGLAPSFQTGIDPC